MIRSNILTLSIICIFLAILAFLLLEKFRKILILRKIPSPESLPLIGLTLDILLATEVDLFNKGRESAKQFEGIYRLSLMHYDIVNIYNAGDIEQILSGYNHLTKGVFYGFLENWLGTGLLTSEGDKWRLRRKLLTPAFHFQILQDFLTCFNEETNILVKDIENNIEECANDIKPFIVSFTMKSICETAMGLDQIEEKVFKTYRQRMKTLAQLYIKRVQCLWYRIVFLYNFSSMAVEEKKMVDDLHNFSNSVIRDRMKMREGNYVKKNKMAMLDLLLKFKEEGANINEEGIREEVDTFIFEGHDTIATATQFILLLLANNPDVQKKAVEEIQKVFNGENRDCTKDDLRKLEYLECCIKETLRIYPSVPFISRECGEEYTTSTGYRIPKGSTLSIHVFDLHRDPNIFPQPEKFDPERFKLENSSKRPPFSYIPFSAGPRNCIGQRFAMWELKTLLCGILRNFTLEPIDAPEDLVFKCDLVLSTIQPIRIKFIKNTEKNINCYKQV